MTKSKYGRSRTMTKSKRVTTETCYEGAFKPFKLTIHVQTEVEAAELWAHLNIGRSALLRADGYSNMRRFATDRPKDIASEAWNAIDNELVRQGIKK